MDEDQTAPAQGAAEEKTGPVTGPETPATDAPAAPVLGATVTNVPVGVIVETPAGADAAQDAAPAADETEDDQSAIDRLLDGFRGKLVNVRAHLGPARNGDVRACARALSALADLVEDMIAPRRGG